MVIDYAKQICAGRSIDDADISATEILQISRFVRYGRAGRHTLRQSVVHGLLEKKLQQLLTPALANVGPRIDHTQRGRTVCGRGVILQTVGFQHQAILARVGAADALRKGVDPLHSGDGIACAEELNQPVGRAVVARGDHGSDAAGRLLIAECTLIDRLVYGARNEELDQAGGDHASAAGRLTDALADAPLVKEAA